MMLRASWIAVVVVVGCGSEADNRPQVTIPASHADDVNALVPANWRDKIVFEIGVVEEKKAGSTVRYKMAVPVGWKPGPMSGEYVPPDQPTHGDSPTFGGALRLQVWRAA